MTVAVVGSRGFADYDRLAADLDRARAKWGDFEVVSGGARGADQLAERWAKERGLPVRVIQPDWERYGRSAGPRRNAIIVAEADVVVAFWDGASPGTLSTIQMAQAVGKRTFVRRTDAEDEHRRQAEVHQRGR